MTNAGEKEIISKIEELFGKGGEIENPENLKQRNDLENELKINREGKVKSSILKSKANWIENGEKCSKYFCNLETKRYTEKLLTKTEDIMSEQKHFYENLYSKKEHLSHRKTNIFLDDDNPYFTKISDEDKTLCDAELTLADCLNYLKQLKNEKSPRIDGFTVEFFKFFWKDLGVYLFRSIKHAIQTGELSITQRQGIITLIPKAKKLKLYLKNWETNIAIECRL